MDRSRNKDTVYGLGVTNPPSEKEREEDILETLCILRQKGRPVTMMDVCRELNLTRREAEQLRKKMILHDYLLDHTSEELILTSYGKIQGEECLKRHRYLTEFLKLVCGVDEEEAAENACRLEHVISHEVFRGICKFMISGDTYDRVVRNQDLGIQYGAGIYEFRMTIYLIEKKYPRMLAPEFEWFQDQLRTEVGDVSSFYLQLRADADRKDKVILYQEDGFWKQADISEYGCRIPTDIFSYSICKEYPVTEGEALIAFVQAGEEPQEEHVRELNVHLW